MAARIGNTLLGVRFTAELPWLAAWAGGFDIDDPPSALVSTTPLRGRTTHCLPKHISEGRRRSVTELERNIRHAAFAAQPVQGQKQAQPVAPFSQANTDFLLESAGQRPGRRAEFSPPIIDASRIRWICIKRFANLAQHLTVGPRQVKVHDRQSFKLLKDHSVQFVDISDILAVPAGTFQLDDEFPHQRSDGEHRACARQSRSLRVGNVKSAKRGTRIRQRRWLA